MIADRTTYQKASFHHTFEIEVGSSILRTYGIMCGYDNNKTQDKHFGCCLTIIRKL